MTTRNLIFRLYACAVLAVAVGWIVSTNGLSNSLSFALMEETRGTSLMACKFKQSCDAYNRYSGMCAGHKDGDYCYTCQNGPDIVTYLDHARDECIGGWEYKPDMVPPVYCGEKSTGFARCKDQKCETKQFSGDNCFKPDQIDLQ